MLCVPSAKANKQMFNKNKKGTLKEDRQEKNSIECEASLFVLF